MLSAMSVVQTTELRRLGRAEKAAGLELWALWQIAYTLPACHAPPPCGLWPPQCPSKEQGFLSSPKSDKMPLDCMSSRLF